MQRRFLFVLVALAFGAACATQTVHVCLPDHSGSPPAGVELGGQIRVVPVWEGRSLDTYREWLNSTDPDEHANVEAFQTKLREKILHGLGAEFPTVDLPVVSRDEALALVSAPSAVSERLDKPTAARLRAQAGQSSARLEELEVAIEAAVHKAVNGRQSDLHAAGYEPAKREINYVIEQGVTYCIYSTYVVDDPPSLNVQPDWWKVTHQSSDAGEVTAYLDLMVIVRKID